MNTYELYIKNTIEPIEVLNKNGKRTQLASVVKHFSHTVRKAINEGTVAKDDIEFEVIDSSTDMIVANLNYSYYDGVVLAKIYGTIAF